MALTTRKQDTKFWILTTPAVGPGYSFQAGVILTSKTGKIPPALVPHVEPFAGAILPRHRILEIDADEFERHVSDEEHRQQRQPIPDRPLDRSQIVNELFHGDEAAFEAAGGLGFPRSTGQRIVARGMVAFWRARDLEQWRDRIISAAAALTRAR